MRIGIELTALHAEEFSHRGIGRYMRGLLHALSRVDRRHHYVLYHWKDQPALNPQFGESRLLQMPEDLQDVVNRNPDGLDLLVMSAPFAGLHYRGFRLPSRGAHGCRVAAMMYDLIPYIFQDLYLSGLTMCRAYSARLGLLKHYDRLLAISGSTSRDMRYLLAAPAERVSDIGSGVDLDFFRPGGAEENPAQRIPELPAINEPFVLSIGGMDPRKNFEGLVAAFGLLPAELRQAHRLVVTCAMNDAEAQTLRRVAADHGVDGPVLTGHVSEESLRWLYQHCTVFISPSLYEGFGLPIAEAMACGAPVVAANNSAQPEVLGDAGLLFSTGDPIEAAGKLARVLNNSELRADLRRRGLVQAQKFSWQKVARKLEAAMEMIQS